MEQEELHLEYDDLYCVTRGSPDKFRTVIVARSSHAAKEKQRDRRIVVVVESDEGESYIMIGNPSGYDRIVLDANTILDMAGHIEKHRLMKMMQDLSLRDPSIAECLESMVGPFPSDVQPAPLPPVDVSA